MEHLVKFITPENVPLGVLICIIVILVRMLTESNKAKDKMAENMQKAMQENSKVVAAALEKAADAINALSSVVHEMKGIFQMVRK